MHYLIGIILFAFGGLFIMLTWAQFKVWRLITNMSPTRADRVKPGLVEVEGKVSSAGEALVSPYSNKECVYYQFKVEEKRSNHSGNRSHNSHWRNIINDEQSVNCIVQDSYGGIEVELEYAKFHLSTDFRTRSGTFKSASPDLEQMLQDRYGLSSKGFIFNKNWRYTEKVLEVDDPIYVLGYARDIGDDIIITNHEGFGRETDNRKPAKPLLWTGKPPLTVTDKGEGHVSMNYMGTVILLSIVSCVFIALGILLFVAKV